MICREDAQCATEKEEMKNFYWQYLHMVITKWVESSVFSQGTHLYQRKSIKYYLK